MTATFSEIDQQARQKVIDDAKRMRRVIQTRKNCHSDTIAWLERNFVGIKTIEGKLALYDVARHLYEEARRVYRTGSPSTSATLLVPVARLEALPFADFTGNLIHVEDMLLLMAQHYSKSVDTVSVLYDAHVRWTSGASTMLITVRFHI